MARSFRVGAYAFLVFATVAVAGLDSVAHQGASGVVKQRMELMKHIAAATKTIADMIKGAAPLDLDKAAAAADVIAGHARDIPAMFPEGPRVRTHKGDSLFGRSMIQAPNCLGVCHV